MKKFIVISFIALVSSILWGCSNALEEGVISGNSTSIEKSVHLRISEEDAIRIADKILKKNQTRGAIQELPSCEYVINSTPTRSSLMSDTVAYILNYPNEEGFAIISSSRNVNPVLAFSESGNFDFSNEVAKLYFIDNISAYNNNAEAPEIYGNDNYLDGCVVIGDTAAMDIGQWSPWNKYVDEKHPGCPAGCVPVATALAICNTVDSLDYLNEKFYTDSLYSVISGGLPSVPSYSDYVKYNDAVDGIAKLLYYIGADLNTKYSTSESVASSEDVIPFLKRNNIEVVDSYEEYNTSEKTIMRMINELYQGGVIYMRGSQEGGKYGHAWICDGCMFCYEDKPRKQGLLDWYLHINWGWGGVDNGYYNGEVFNADKMNVEFRVTNFFFVRGDKWEPNLPIVKPISSWGI